MDFTPAANPMSSSKTLGHNDLAHHYSGNSYSSSSLINRAGEGSHGIGTQALSGRWSAEASALSSNGAKAAQISKNPRTLPVACEASGGSDNIEFQSTCTVSVDRAVGQKAQAKGAYQVTALSAPAGKQKVRAEARTVRQGEGNTSSQREGNWKFFGTSVNQNLKVDDVVEKIDSGQLWVVNSRRRNGIIVMREFHAEFAGPGAAVGGDLDSGIVKIIPIGNLSLLEPDSHEEHQNAIKIRLQWIRLTQNFTDQASPDDRARMILEQFKTYFDQATVDLVPDEAFAMLVGVLPQTIHRVRAGFVW